MASIVRADGNVKIPADVRKAVGLKAGQKVNWVPKGNTVVLVPALSLDDLRGIAPGADTTGYREHD